MRALILLRLDTDVHLSFLRRVMPRCWFVLLRFWLRVDGCMVRMRETRLFCRHHSDPGRPQEVLKEVKFCEGSFEEIRKAGGPSREGAFADPDAASQILSAVAPALVKRYQRFKLSL